jgi:hypothetical protein
VRQFINDHFSSLLGVALIGLGVTLCIKDGSLHSGELGEQLLACGLLAVNVARPPAGSQ